MKNIYKLLFITFILLLTSSCSEVNHIQSETPEVSETVLTEEIKDLSIFYNQKVKCLERVIIYDSEGNESGFIYKDAYLNLSDNQLNNYINIKDTENYISTEGIEISDDLRYYGNNLIPYNKKVSLEDCDIENYYGQKFMHITKEIQTPVYVLSGENDRRYGVEYMNNIYFVNEDDIKEIIDDNDKSIDNTAEQLPVLMYHFFYNDENNETAKDNNYMEVKSFEEQLIKLNDDDYTSLTMKEILWFVQDRAQVPEKSYGLTIDDGDPSVYKYAFPLLKEYNIRATNFVIGGWMGEYLPYEFLEMRKYGIEPQSHSFLMHQPGSDGKGRLMTIDYQTGVEDTKMSLEYVDRGFAYCYPFGHYNNKVIKMISDGGAKIAFTTEFGQVTKDSDILALPRIRVSADNDITIFMNNLK